MATTKICPVHGNLGSLDEAAETIVFYMDERIDIVCLRCWRDWLLENMPKITLVEE